MAVEGPEPAMALNVPLPLALIAGTMVLFVFLVYLFFRRTVTAFTEGMRGDRD